MIIRQTTTIVFEYPQDYLQEQEWRKTKGDRWVHKSTDTLCSVYENQISYCIGQPKDDPFDKDINVRSNDEPQTCSVSGRPYSECADCEHFKCTADEPQKIMEKCYSCKWWNYSYGCSNKKGICEFEPLKDEQSGKE